MTRRPTRSTTASRSLASWDDDSVRGYLGDGTSRFVAGSALPQDWTSPGGIAVGDHNADG